MMNKFDFAESIYPYAIQFFSGLGMLSTWLVGINPSVNQWLLSYGLTVEYFYFGLLGQIIYTFMAIKQRLENEEIIATFSVRKLIAILIGWGLAPVLSMLLVSYFFPTYSLGFGIIALGLGASLEQVWDFIKKYALKKIGTADETVK